MPLKPAIVLALIVLPASLVAQSPRPSAQPPGPLWTRAFPQSPATPRGFGVPADTARRFSWFQGAPTVVSTCPMPVAASDTTLTQRMPMIRRDTTEVARMPVVRGGCTNPLRTEPAPRTP